MKKKIKDLTIEDIKKICKKARTKKNGKVRQYCVSDCPLNLSDGLIDKKICDVVVSLNSEIEVEDDE